MKQLIAITIAVFLLQACAWDMILPAGGTSIPKLSSPQRGQQKFHVYLQEPLMNNVKELDSDDLKEIMDQQTTRMGHKITHVSTKANVILLSKLVYGGKYFIFHVKTSKGRSARRRTKSLKNLDRMVYSAVKSVLDSVELDYPKDSSNRSVAGATFEGNVGTAVLGETGSRGPAIIYFGGSVGRGDEHSNFGLRVDSVIDCDEGTKDVALISLALDLSLYPFNTLITPFISITAGLAFARHARMGVWYVGYPLGGAVGLALRLHKDNKTKLLIGVRGAIIVGTGYREIPPRYLALFMGIRI